jgi:hypothetical protein
MKCEVRYEIGFDRYNDNGRVLICFCLGISIHASDEEASREGFRYLQSAYGIL